MWRDTGLFVNMRILSKRRGTPVKIAKDFVLVVLNLAAELWTGIYRRKPDFYDKHASARTKAGNAAFVALASLSAIGIVSWLCVRIYN